jgi:hypothetical protein
VQDLLAANILPAIFETLDMNQKWFPLKILFDFKKVLKYPFIKILQ